ncbi:MAG: transporter [Planctomycetes bacterium]|nr:transporter [Planctomycetota bacterium]
MRRILAIVAMACVSTTWAAAQAGTLDVLDGETLYDGGWLVTLGFDYELRDTVRQGKSRRHGLALDAEETEFRTSLAAHYGLRNDVQVGLLTQYRDLGSDVDSFAVPSANGTAGSAGFGDLELFAKWRFFRYDAPHVAFNVALIGGLTIPTGEDDAGTPRLEPEQQVGRGSFDPSVGIGITHEPGRWRFNAAALYHASLDTDGDDSKPGESFTALLEVGNRFWLEPYPGPFMRLDVGLQFDRETHDSLGGILPNTGGERIDVVSTLAFRPRPSLDFQLHGGIPIWQDVNGIQVSTDYTIGFTFGYRF